MKTIASLGLAVITTITGYAQPPLPDTWIPNSRVTYLTRGDGKVLVSGYFDWFGEYYGSGAAVFDATLAHDNGYPKVPYSIELAIPDDAGGWYTATYGSLSHIKADKTVEQLPVTIAGGGINVTGMAKVGNILYLGGQFTLVNNIPRNYVAAIDLTTNTLTPWNPNANGYVYCLKASGGVIYVGGSFSSIGGLARSKIAAIDPATGLSTAWNANVSAGFGYVYTIEVGPGGVYFGGNFSNVGGGIPSRTNLAAVNTTTGALTSFNPRPNGIVYLILLDGNTLYVAGAFSQIAGVTRSVLTALDVTTGLLTPFAVSLTAGNVYALAIDGQKLFIGGNFLTANGAEQPRLAVVDKTTGALEPTVPRAISDYVQSISISGSKVLVGGYFFRGISGRSNSLQVIALDETTGKGTNWIPEMPQPPSDGYIAQTYFHYQNNRVFYWQDVYHPITPVGYASSTLGALNSTDGAAIPAWSVTVDGNVTAWTFSDDALFLGGNFNLVNGTTRNGFAAVDLVTGALLPLTIPYSPDYLEGEAITSMAVSNQVLYVAGKFSFTDGGVPRNNLAAWNATTGVITPWAPQVTLETFEHVDVGTVHNAKVYLIGDVVMRVDATTGAADEWNPDYYYAVDGFDGKGGCSSIAIQDSYVYLAGSFSPGLVRVGITSGARSDWQPDFTNVYETEGAVRSIAVSETKLFAGGSYRFDRAGVELQDYAVFELPAEVPNEPPQITATTAAVPSEGFVTIDLVPLITDADDNLDWSTLRLLSDVSEQGAEALLDESFVLTLNYGGIQFSGTDRVALEVCDLLEACSQQELTIEVGGEILIYTGISPNGDGKNDVWIIRYIDAFPDATVNHVSVFNRWGDAVFETDNYDNINRVFTGLNKGGKELPTGTYFYRIEFASGRKTMTGYFSLKR